MRYKLHLKAFIFKSVFELGHNSYQKKCPYLKCTVQSILANAALCVTNTTAERVLSGISFTRRRSW